MKKIGQLLPSDRPREKLLAKGPSSLSDDELVAVLLGKGTQNNDIRKLSKTVAALLRTNPDLKELQNIEGIGSAKAAQIVAVLELGRRLYAEKRPKIDGPEAVYRLCADFREKKQEHFVVFTLDGNGVLLEKRTVFIGTLNQSLVHPREVYADAIADRAAGIIVAHNHPSGSLEPSIEDRQVTRRLHEAGVLLGINFLDHLVVSGEGYYSFKDAGEL